MRGAMRVLLTLAATAWFVLVQSAAAAVPAVSPEGRWIVRASGTPMTLLILERTEKRLTGTVTRPKILHLRSGQVFTEVEGPAITEKIEKIVEHNGVLELTLPSSHKHLAEKTYQEKLKSELMPRLGHNLRILISIGESAGASLAAHEDRERSQQQLAAEAAIDTDPFIKHLRQDFGAEVVRSSIRPANS